MKKMFRFVSVLSVALLLASCQINIGPASSDSSDEPADSTSSTGGDSSSSSDDKSSSSSSDESSSSSSSDDQSSSSSDDSSSSSSSEPDVPTKTKLAYTYDDYYENCYYTKLNNPVDNAPTIGSANLLVLPVWFTDSGNYITSDNGKENIKNDIEIAFFGTEAQTGWHSVRSFYEGESMGRLTVNGKVADWYECTYASTDVTDSDTTNDVVMAAVSNYFGNNPKDSRKNYDANGDGYLDAVVIIYAAPNYGDCYVVDRTDTNCSNDNLWAYCYWMQGDNKQTRNKKAPNTNTYFWSSYDFMYSQEQAKQKTGKAYGYGDNANFDIDCHTYIHEMGHAFGLDDLYDYSSHGYSPAGDLTMQDYNVGGHDPYSVMAYGWADPYIAKKAGKYTLKPFQSSHDVLLLTPLWNDYDSPFDEYILVELYTPTGMNKMDADHALDGRSALPSNTGIRVWHIDARLWGLVDNTFDESEDLTSNVEGNYEGGVLQAFSNTYQAGGNGTPLGNNYINYNLVQYIRNDTSSTYTPNDSIKNSNMFYNGDTFSMSTYSKQFVKSGKLNSGKSLGWGFSIEIEGEGESAVATINLYNE